MIAADIMRTDVVTVHQNQTVKELAALLMDHAITGVPVVDDQRRVVGVVSQTDLVRREREQGSEHEAPVYHQELDRWLGRHGFQVEAPEYLTVREVMTPSVLSADASTPVSELARRMDARHVHRLVITRGGKLAGIVTSMDILRAFIAREEGRTRP